MGMFSWACKGCGHDLKMDELVRMNGRKGAYDGYGGNGGFDWKDTYFDSEPACWHERCYRNATKEERADKTPSENAENQGFGFPALAFLPGYNERRKTTHNCVVYVREGDKRYEYHLVKSGDGFGLQDQEAYDAAWEGYSDYEFPENYDDMTTAEREAFMCGIKDKFEQSTGLKSPKEHAVRFESLEEAKNAILPFLFLMQNYHLVIFGSQGKIQGQCYSRERWRSGENGTFDDSVEYEHGVPAKKATA